MFYLRYNEDNIVTLSPKYNTNSAHKIGGSEWVEDEAGFHQVIAIFLLVMGSTHTSRVAKTVTRSLMSTELTMLALVFVITI